MCRSPLLAIAAYEREHGIPDNYINCAMYGPNRLGNVDKDNFAGDLGVALEQAVAEDQKKVAEMNELNKLMGECATGKSRMSLNVGRGESTDL